MRNYLFNLIVILLSFLANMAHAAAPATHRTTLITNGKVNVWKTIIYPSSNQQLTMHSHLYDRVVVAFTDGTLKVVNNKGKIHYLKFEKDKAYYLAKDVVGELHSDENISHHPIKLVVIELKS
jgi:beta-alanine degradation protein BauB